MCVCVCSLIDFLLAFFHGKQFIVLWSLLVRNCKRSSMTLAWVQVGVATSSALLGHRWVLVRSWGRWHDMLMTCCYMGWPEALESQSRDVDRATELLSEGTKVWPGGLERPDNEEMQNFFGVTWQNEFCGLLGIGFWRPVVVVGGIWCIWLLLWKNWKRIIYVICCNHNCKRRREQQIRY